MNKAQKKNSKARRPLPKIPQSVPGLTNEQLSIVPRLSKCAAEYACAMEDPFNCNGLACVPDLPAVPSRKMLVFNKGTMTIGTAGLGFVLCRPYDGVANDRSCGTVSGLAYAGTTVTSVVGTGVTSFTSNSDYAQASIGAANNSIQYRLVGGGIRIKYTGTELNRSGMVFHVEETVHGDLSGNTVAQLEAYDQTLKTPVVRNWHSVVIHPVTGNEIRYAYQVPGTGVAPPTNSSICLAVTSTAGNTFDYEYFALFEVNGPAVRGKTPSDVDTPGMAAVLNTVQSMKHVGYVGEPNHTTIIGNVWNSLVKGISGIASLAWENRGAIMNAALKAMSLI